jgi:hypothetical protein
MIKPLMGTYGQSGVGVALKLRDAGCNALWFHGFDEKGFDGCIKNGLQPCVEFRTFRESFDKRPDLIPTGIDGKPIRFGKLVQGICLSKSDFVDEREQELRDGVTSYAPAGVWFDYLTGAGWFETPDPDLQESCFCPDCVQDFCESTGVDAASPSEIINTYQKQWTDHKCERIAGFGQRFAKIVKDALPSAMIGAYMCPWTPQEFDGALTRIFGQDYQLFGEFIDVFTPLIYTTKSGRPSYWSAEFLEGAVEYVPEGHPVQPILDALDYPGSLQALVGASVKSWGFQLYDGAKLMANPESAAQFAKLIASL